MRILALIAGILSMLAMTVPIVGVVLLVILVPTLSAMYRLSFDVLHDWISYKTVQFDRGHVRFNLLHRSSLIMKLMKLDFLKGAASYLAGILGIIVGVVAIIKARGWLFPLVMMSFESGGGVHSVLATLFKSIGMISGLCALIFVLMLPSLVIRYGLSQADNIYIDKTLHNDTNQFSWMHSDVDVGSPISAMDALSKSWELMKHHKFSYWLLNFGYVLERILVSAILYIVVVVASIALKGSVGSLVALLLVILVSLVTFYVIFAQYQACGTFYDTLKHQSPSGWDSNNTFTNPQPSAPRTNNTFKPKFNRAPKYSSINQNNNNNPLNTTNYGTSNNTYVDHNGFIQHR